MNDQDETLFESIRNGVGEFIWAYVDALTPIWEPIMRLLSRLVQRDDEE